MAKSEVALFVLGFLSLAAPALAQELPDGPGKEVVVRACSSCHSTDTIQGRHQDKAAWTDTVFRMVDFGAETTKEDRDAIVAYLTAAFGPMKVPRAPAAEAAPATTSTSEAAPVAAAPPAAATAKDKDTPINVNVATAKDLESALSLTAKEAEAFVQYREKHGPFKNWADVIKVEGIDAKKIEAAKNRITFGDSALPPKSL